MARVWVWVGTSIHCIALLAVYRVGVQRAEGPGRLGLGWVNAAQQGKGRRGCR
jgi:hypothetical protein